MKFFMSDKQIQELVDKRTEELLTRTQKDIINKTVEVAIVNTFGFSDGNLKYSEALPSFKKLLMEWYPDLYKECEDRLKNQIYQLNDDVLRSMIEAQGEEVYSKLVEKIMDKQQKTMEMLDSKLKSKDFIVDLIAEINKYQIKGSEIKG